MAAMAAETPTQASAHPAESLLPMKQEVVGQFLGQRVGRSTEQLQQVLMTVGAIKKVPKKAEAKSPKAPRLSLTPLPLMRGYNSSKQAADTTPAKIPQVIAAPMLMQVPATGPYMIAPAMVPTKEARMPNRWCVLISTEKAQVERIDALRAIKVEMKASCQMNSLAKSSPARVYLVEKREVVAQKERKRKKVPNWLVTAELLLLENSGVNAAWGFFKNCPTTNPQNPANRQTQLI